MKGPLNIARSKQGQPVVFQAGSSEVGKNYASKEADAIFTGHETLEDAQAFYNDVKKRVASFDRNPDEVLIFLELLQSSVTRRRRQSASTRRLLAL